MTKEDWKQLWEGMARAHTEAHRQMVSEAKLAGAKQNTEFSEMCWCAAMTQHVLARAFRDLAKEQE